MRAMVSRHDQSFDFKKIAIDIDAAADVPEVLCTETEIEQVMLNLVRNAAQAMAEAHVEFPKIAITIERVPAGVRVVVEDNGPGMSVEIQRRVFEL